MKAFRVILCGMILAPVLAGPAGAGTMYVGVKGGVNMGDLGGDDAPTHTSMRTGFTGGAFLGSDLNEQFGVRGEVLYVQKGVEGDITTMDGDVHPGKANVDYIDVPILLDARFPAGDKLGFDVFAGPSFNFNLKSEVTTEDGLEDRKDQTKSFEFGAAIGAGVRYVLSSVSIVADVRYSLGASTLSEDVEGQSVDVKNRGIGVCAGLSFPMGGR